MWLFFAQEANLKDGIPKRPQTIQKH